MVPGTGTNKTDNRNVGTSQGLVHTLTGELHDDGTQGDHSRGQNAGSEVRDLEQGQGDGVGPVQGQEGQDHPMHASATGATGFNAEIPACVFSFRSESESSQQGGSHQYSIPPSPQVIPAGVLSLESNADPVEVLDPSQIQEDFPVPSSEEAYYGVRSSNPQELMSLIGSLSEIFVRRQEAYESKNYGKIREVEAYLRSISPIGVLTDSRLKPNANHQYRQDEEYWSSPLGVGTFGSVSYCVDVETKHSFARKQVSLKQFERKEVEVLIANAPMCPYIPWIFGVVFEGDAVNIFMTFIDCTWSRLVDILPNYNQSVVEVTIRRLLKQLLLALKDLHMQGICHCDIKPDNCGTDHMVSHCYLMDFGTVRLATDRFSPKGMTPEYMSPEACQGRNDIKMDIWAAACSVYFMFTRQHPWHDRRPAQRTQESVIQFLGFIRTNGGLMRDRYLRQVPVSEPLFNLLYKMLHPNPDHRPSASDCIHEIEIWEHEEAASAGRTAQPLSGAIPITVQSVAGLNPSLSAHHGLPNLSMPRTYRQPSESGTSASGMSDVSTSQLNPCPSPHTHGVAGNHGDLGSSESQMQHLQLFHASPGQHPRRNSQQYSPPHHPLVASRRSTVTGNRKTSSKPYERPGSGSESSSGVSTARHKLPHLVARDSSTTTDHGFLSRSSGTSASGHTGLTSGYVSNDTGVTVTLEYKTHTQTFRASATDALKSVYDTMLIKANSLVTPGGNTPTDSIMFCEKFRDGSERFLLKSHLDEQISYSRHYVVHTEMPPGYR